jgi:GrpB-like predicted nucleotidyltransferase (UPF0157 family)
LRNKIFPPDIIGLDWDALDIKPYCNTWADLFRNEADFLLHTFHPWMVEIEHVGSTSIPGMSSKPVID